MKHWQYLTNPEQDIQELESLLGMYWEKHNPSEIQELLQQEHAKQIEILRKLKETNYSLEDQLQWRNTSKILSKWAKIINNPEKTKTLITEANEYYDNAAQMKAFLDNLPENQYTATNNDGVRKLDRHRPKPLKRYLLARQNVEQQYLTDPQKDIQELQSLFGSNWTEQNNSNIYKIFTEQKILQINIINNPDSTAEQRIQARLKLSLLGKWYAILKVPSKKSYLIKEIRQYLYNQQLKKIIDNLLEETSTPTITQKKQQTSEQHLLALLPKTTPNSQQSTVLHPANDSQKPDSKRLPMTVSSLPQILIQKRQRRENRHN